VFAGRVEKVAI